MKCRFSLILMGNDHLETSEDVITEWIEQVKVLS